MQVIQKDVKELIPYARNARTHSDEQVAKIAASIKEFGWTNPILLDGENGIVAGHGRLMAARKLGMQQVPCIELAHLTKAQKRAYVLADNKLALDAGWDVDVLKVEIDELIFDGFDVKLAGFDDSDFQKIVDEEGETESDKEGEKEVAYTQKVLSPIYEPKGEKPALSSIVDTRRYDAIMAEIDASSVSEEEKAFLRLAAGRHVALNYQMCADYFSHSGQEVRSLFESSALVIVDYGRAVELGFIRLREEIVRLSGESEKLSNSGVGE